MRRLLTLTGRGGSVYKDSKNFRAGVKSSYVFNRLLTIYNTLPYKIHTARRKYQTPADILHYEVSGLHTISQCEQD
jgi:hypothetical protein